MSQTYQSTNAEVLQYTFIVDQQVNIVKSITLGEALERYVPEDKRHAVKLQYEEWHRVKAP